LVYYSSIISFVNLQYNYFDIRNDVRDRKRKVSWWNISKKKKDLKIVEVIVTAMGIQLISVQQNIPERQYAFGCSSDDVVDGAALSVSASDRNLTLDNWSINFPWSSDKLQTQKLSFVGTVRKAK